MLVREAKGRVTLTIEEIAERIKRNGEFEFEVSPNIPGFLLNVKGNDMAYTLGELRNLEERGIFPRNLQFRIYPDVSKGGRSFPLYFTATKLHTETAKDLVDVYNSLQSGNYLIDIKEGRLKLGDVRLFKSNTTYDINETRLVPL